MDKFIYDNIRLRWTKSYIFSKRAEDFPGYKDYGTLREFKEILWQATCEVKEKRRAREKLATPFDTRKDYKNLLRMKKGELFKRMIRTPYNKGTAFLHRDEGFSFKVYEETDWNFYGRSYKYPKIWHTGVFYTNLDKITTKDIKEYGSIDGIINLEILHKKQIGSMLLMKTVSLLRCKPGFCSKVMYIAVQNGFSYHSEVSFKKAIKGLQRKLQKETKFKNLSEDSYITRKAFKELTGACNPGIKQFCEENNLTEIKKIKIKDLMPILKGHYGYETIKNALKKEA